MDVLGKHRFGQLVSSNLVGQRRISGLMPTSPARGSRRGRLGGSGAGLPPPGTGTRSSAQLVRTAGAATSNPGSEWAVRRGRTSAALISHAMRPGGRTVSECPPCTPRLVSSQRMVLNPAQTSAGGRRHRGSSGVPRALPHPRALPRPRPRRRWPGSLECLREVVSPATDHRHALVDVKVQHAGVPVSERPRDRRLPDPGGPVQVYRPRHPGEAASRSSRATYSSATTPT
jgi:hypothetical protein